MSTYAYCAAGNCEGTFDPPTLAEATLGYQICPRCQSYHRQLDDFERTMVTDNLADVVRKLCHAAAVHAEFKGIDRSVWDALAESIK